jgi:hypothetical protein
MHVLIATIAAAVALGAPAANRICNVVTGKGYDNGSGQGLVSALLQLFGRQWVLATTGTVPPLQPLCCTR